MISDELLITASHVIILASTVGGVVTSLLNRKKLNKIEITLNGGLINKIKTAIKEVKDAS